MEIGIAIAVGALFAALAPLYAMWITFRQNTDTERGRDKDERIRELEATVRELRDENLALMRRVLKNGN